MVLLVLFLNIVVDFEFYPFCINKVHLFDNPFNPKSLMFVLYKLNLVNKVHLFDNSFNPESLIFVLYKLKLVNKVQLFANSVNPESLIFV